MSDYRLGKKIVPIPVPEVDEFERFKGLHGDTLIRNKRTGVIETEIVQSGPRREPPPEPAKSVYEHMADILRKQREDGFDPCCWGVL